MGSEDEAWAFLPLPTPCHKCPLWSSGVCARQVKSGQGLPPGHKRIGLRQNPTRQLAAFHAYRLQIGPYLFRCTFDELGVTTVAPCTLATPLRRWMLPTDGL